MERERGQLDRAIALHAESLARARKGQDAWILAFVLTMGGNLAWLAGDFQRGVTLYRESLLLSRDIRAKWPIAECLWGLSGLAAAQGQFERAARLYGGERAVREATGAIVLGDVARFERELAVVRAVLGEARFTAAVAEGQAMTLERAVDDALGGSEGMSRAGDGATHGRGELLSQREWDVAALVAGGLTNRQIADHLVVGVRTAESHVASALGKLGLKTRAQLASWITAREAIDRHIP
jgi:DNA-binding CsgD family transcriptional regulator